MLSSISTANNEESSAEETIVAQATAQGRGGVAIVRVSGPTVTAVMRAVLKTKLKPRFATYLPFFADDDSIIDQGLALYFPKPHSFTGEEVLELHLHGGPIVVDLLLKRIIALNVRLARPGEFSERAFLNGKLDLAQAEAIADLINSTSEQAARSAMRSLQGEFSTHINTIVKKIIELRMYVEAAIDFVDEAIEFLQHEKLQQQVNSILQDINSLQKAAKQGALLRDGITVAIIGAPNVGKSSLLNRLSNKEIAIVTSIPGTTRDVLRESILIDGIPLHICDTAGLRESDDIVEQEGMRRTLMEIEQADIILHIQDITQPPSKQKLVEAHLKAKIIDVYNKIDLLQRKPSLNDSAGKPEVALSAQTGEGIELLKIALKTQIGLDEFTENTFLARRRHLHALSQAEKHVQLAQRQMQQSSPLGELVAEDLRQAQQALNAITGEFSADDLLGEIFSSFCIGK